MHCFGSFAIVRLMASAEVTAYFAFLDAADTALAAGDTAAELLALRRAMIESAKLATVSQQGGNSVDWASARQAIQNRIDRLQKAATAAAGPVRTKIEYIAPTA